MNQRSTHEVQTAVTSLSSVIDEAVSQGNTEVYVRGKWFIVPAVNVTGVTIVSRGKLLKTAYIKSEEWLENELHDPERCVRELKHKTVLGRVDLLTFSQKPSCLQPKYKYSMEWESVAAIKLRSFKEWWEGLPQATRKNVRRSEKRGVRVERVPFTDEVVSGLVKLNNESPFRQGVPNVQYGKSFEQVRKDHCSFEERSDFFCAYFEDELVGFLKMVYRGEVASILNLLPSARHDDKRPANALIAKAVERCAERGISHITYGLFNYGNKRESPLREFKIRNGFEEVLVPRYYVALTLLGACAIKLKLHRGLLGVLPEWAIAMGLNLRSKLYSLNPVSKPV